MIFMVVPFEGGANIEGLSKKLDGLNCPVFRDEEPNAWFISYSGTTMELSNAIGFGEDTEVGTGIVIPVSTYFGYASAALWEWLRTYQHHEP